MNILEIQILSTLQTLYDAWGWFGVATLLSFENATGITPSEIILGLAGWMLISDHQLHPSMILLGGLYAAIGSALGASIAYWVARLGGRPLVDKLARWVRIDPAHITNVEKQFQRWGTGFVLIGRVMPGIRTLISTPAGLARIPFLQFLVFTFMGTYIWCTSIIGVGYIVGHEWLVISEWVGRFTPWVIAGFVTLGGVGLITRWLIKRRLCLQPVFVKTDEKE